MYQPYEIYFSGSQKLKVVKIYVSWLPNNDRENSNLSSLPISMLTVLALKHDSLSQ